MSTIKEQIAVMQAFSEGKEIEFRRRFFNDWKDCLTPLWNWYGFDYRIKQAVQAKYTLYVSNKHGGFISWVTCANIISCQGMVKAVLEQKEYSLLFVVKVTEDGKTEVAHVNPDGTLQAPSGF